MKKSLYWLLIVIMIVAVITTIGTIGIVGCKKEAAEETTAAETTTEETTAAAELQPNTELSGTISIWTFEPYVTAWQDGRFNKIYPNIKLDITGVDYPDSHTKFLSAAAAGEGLPDIMMTVTPLIVPYASIGALVDLTSIVASYMDKVPQWAWDLDSYQDKVYAVPFDSGPSVLFYRSDIFQSAEIDPNSIQTWSDWFEAGKKIYEATNGKTKLLCMTRSGAMDWAGEAIGLQIMQQIGSGVYDKDGKIIIDNPENVEVLKFLKEVLDSGICLEESYWTPGNYSAMEDGSVATVPQGSWMGGYIKMIAPKSQGKWNAMLLPAWSSGGSRYSNNGGSFLAITTQSKNQELAWKFIEWELLTKDTTLFDLKNFDKWPLLKEDWTDPLIDEPDSFFTNNQAVRKLYVDVATNVTPLYFGPNWPEAYVTVQQVMTDYFNGKMSPEDALKTVAEKLSTIE